MSNQEIYYSYVKKVYSKEHMLFAHEIASMYNIRTKTNNPADRFVSAYLQRAVSNIPDYEQLYYVTKYGETKVYPKAIYHPIMKSLIAQLKKDTVTTVSIDNKRYHIKFGGLKNENI